MVVAPDRQSSLNTVLHPAFFKAVIWRAGFWSSVETRAYPYFKRHAPTRRQGLLLRSEYSAGLVRRERCIQSASPMCQGREKNAKRVCHKRGREEGERRVVSWPDCATNICNMASPLFTRLWRMVHNLPFVRHRARRKYTIPYLG